MHPINVQTTRQEQENTLSFNMLIELNTVTMIYHKIL